ncbi:methylated-DNA-[protein]-cysteine S-methyltransferase [Bathymodiolus japonicus methanotrophic gill symbiont]|uniref:methylated-DNA--[protein]-cysteine S-methyltransferase n=1 Tax=Bathymodiolus japonicus methanotrophic gill symbiont TaxID=113269 RepID=UPI001B468DE9|nr:methylated-DNA--[protein]-cysteine S-methyltransferase [Bathymodiolus japonicus methanotrophic gill symbiont]GFO71547.1 methylated-DNA-[protein]-cysteine S-methyltransferase [Bathymodiolus japonicus methanotrophic gill symbiont]
MLGEFLSTLQWVIRPGIDTQHTELPTALEQQINQYWLTGKMTMHTGMLKQGTEFQRKIWHALCQIPVGQTKTYGELAKELNTGSRALANACRKNPFPLIIPCHRVLSKTGLGGYAGATTGKLVDIKIALLQHEKMLAHEL